VLDRATHASIGGRGISDFAHVNRVEGLGLGIDGRIGLGGTWRAVDASAYGFSDQQLKGGLEVSWMARPGMRLTLFGGRVYRDAGDVAESLGRSQHNCGTGTRATTTPIRTTCMRRTVAATRTG
jgi:hypothetical protein